MVGRSVYPLYSEQISSEEDIEESRQVATIVDSLNKQHQPAGNRIESKVMFRVVMLETRSDVTEFGVPMRVRKVVKSHWSDATMRRRRQGNDKKVCSICLLFTERRELQDVSSLRCVMYTVAGVDMDVFGPQREKRFECKHICTSCCGSIMLLRYLRF